jgi:hypothetical protein
MLRLMLCTVMVTRLKLLQLGRKTEHRACVVLILSIPSNINQVYGTSGAFPIGATVTSTSSATTSPLSSTLASCVFSHAWFCIL